MKPNESLADDAAYRFRTTHWIGVLLAAQGQMPCSLAACALFCWLYTDPQAIEREIHALCEAFIDSEGGLGP
jgi:uncharacterized Fe-S cluster-containing radical SAM superfamily protein